MTHEYNWNRLGNCEKDYQPRKPILGIRDAIKNVTAAKEGDDRFGQMFFRTIIAAAPLTKFPPTDALIKGVAMMGGTHNTKGVSMPFWVDGEKPLGSPGTQSAQGTTPEAYAAHATGHQPSSGSTAEENATSAPSTGGRAAAEPTSSTGTQRIQMNTTAFSNVHAVKPPEEMLHDAVENATYLAIMNECLCRKIQGCTDYPLDLGCLFLGPAARSCVERGIAIKATKQQAHDHIDRAKAAGLSASAYFVEVEEYVWGFHDKDMPNFLEICFCCPCCCSAVKFEQGAGGELKRILHQRSGWSCVVDAERCIGCGACQATCPHDNIHVVNGKAQVSEWCAGCGQCLKACAHDALMVKRTGATKPSVMDYFDKLHAQI